MLQLLMASLLATAFVGLYAYGTYDAIETASRCYKAIPECGKDVTEMPNISFLLNTVGSLISGTVIGLLALSSANELPAAQFFKKGRVSLARSIAAHIPVSFILVWIVCGMAMVIWGFIKYPDAVPPLTAQAKAWLGSAGAALLAYLAPTGRNNGHDGGN
jgi:hypothetical protein